MTYQMLPPADEEALQPRVLPTGWTRVPWHIPAYEMRSMTSPHYGLRVFVTVGIEDDDRRWMHVSVSRSNRCPSWEDMDMVKRIFIGDDRAAYQVHPSRAEHYSAPKELPAGPRVGTVLHLWSPLEGALPLPNFLHARGGTL